MPSAATPTKRERLITAARQLTYAHGFARTTLADVASASGVPLGNVYYYFRTKAALGEALVELLVEEYRAAIASWEALPDPRERLLAWVEMTFAQRQLLTSHGCPIGSLCAELAKEDPALCARASVVFHDLVAFAERQFRACAVDDAHASALHLLASLQGATLVAHTFQDGAPIVRETEALRRVIGALEPRRQRDEGSDRTAAQPRRRIRTKNALGR